MAIIKHIRALTSVGIFADIRPAAPSIDFKRYNLIYGFNGSGKTSLARLFASLESGEVDPRLPANSAFSFELTDQTQRTAPGALTGLEGRVAVFSSDYVSKNLQWPEGTATPIYYIGADQADAAAKINAAEAEVPALLTAEQTAQKALADAEKLFANHKRDRARLIESHLHLGGRTKYQAPSLAAAYEAGKHFNVQTLSEEELNAHEATLRLDAPIPKLTEIAWPFVEAGEALRRAIRLAGTSVGGVLLAEIAAHPEMLPWVKEGHDYHQGHSLDSCLFCSGPLTEARKQALAAALDDKIAALFEDAEAAKQDLASLIHRLRTAALETPPTASLSAQFQGDYHARLSEAQNWLDALITNLGAALNLLDTKLAAPTKPISTDGVISEADQKELLGEIAATSAAINVLIGKHNDAFDKFAAIQKDARDRIEAHFLVETAQEFYDLAEQLAARNREFGAAKALHEKKGEELTDLRRQVREHGAAAEKINALIKSYLGHAELKVEPVDEGYQIWRHGALMEGHPSDGEKTAIALCYFLSSLDADGRELRNMIVVIDDPISSLDTGALNFCCSLIKSRLDSAEQLFILTHNHHCMNEFKKGSWKSRSKANPPTAAFLYLDVQRPMGDAKRTTKIVEMPKYLRAYDSEYYFLYERTLRFVEDPDASPYFHLMPNVLRRVLDVFLAFKDPGSHEFAAKLRNVAEGVSGVDQDRLAALERLSQVESHSDSLDDLISFSSMTIEETKGAAAALLHLINAVDERHGQRMAELCRAAG